MRPVLRWPRGGWLMTVLDCGRLIILVSAVMILLYRREWFLIGGILVWTAYALLLPGVCGLWRFRAVAEPVWTITVAAAWMCFPKKLEV
jgi:hypothetical protein